MVKLRGAFTAMITPMNQDGSVDYEGFRKNVIFQLEQGIDGLVPLGTTAETPTLDETPGSEEDKLIDESFSTFYSADLSVDEIIALETASE